MHIFPWLAQNLVDSGDKNLLLVHECDEYLNTSKEKHIYDNEAQMHLYIRNTINVSEANKLFPHYRFLK